MPSAAAATSASSKTTTGALPPSSRCTRLTSLDALAATSMPARDRAGDRHHGRRLVADHRASAVTVAAHDVEDTGRQELGGEFGEHDRGDRCGVAGLEHDGVAGGEGRRDLPYRHHERVVPRRDLTAHADRFAPDERGVARHVLRGGATFEYAGGTGEEADLVHSGRHLVGGHGQTRLAGVEHLGVHELASPCLHRVGDLEQRLLPVGRRGALPRLERGRGSLHGHIDVGGRRDRGRAEHRPVRGVDQVTRPAVLGVGERAGDEVAHGSGFGHSRLRRGSDSNGTLREPMRRYRRNQRRWPVLPYGMRARSRPTRRNRLRAGWRASMIGA